MSETASVLMLGARSWVGFRLWEALVATCPAWRLTGTTRSAAWASRCAGGIRHAVAGADFLRLHDELHPDILINLLRDEDSEALALHRKLIDVCVRSGSLYCYASSSQAVEGYSGTPLTEDLTARAVTPYGRFKQACEEALRARPDCHYLILRFASIQGWSPYKPSRSEVFLRRVSSGQRVRVDVGVRQNRMLDRTFAAAVVDLLRARVTGVVHLGTWDASEEIHFLRRVAGTFGWNKALIVEGNARRVNLAVTPSRLQELFGDRYRCSEADTLAGLRCCQELAAYRRSR